MLALDFKTASSKPLQVLCLGCHSDDIEIGCGGTVIRLAEQYPDAVFHWVVMSACGPRAAEARHGAKLFLGDRIQGGPILKEFRDGFMPYAGADVKAAFEELKALPSPDLILTHNRRDAHQDHRLIAELTWNTFRDHFILEYEIPKYDGDMGQPQFFVPLSEDICRRKVAYLMDAFATQRSKRWFQPEMFSGLMRVRGMECNAPAGYAEAFYCRKAVL